MYQIAAETHWETFPNIRSENALLPHNVANGEFLPGKGKYELGWSPVEAGERAVVAVLLCLLLHNGRYF